MVRVSHKDGYVGGRISRKLQNQFDKWTADNLISKTDILEHCVREFLSDPECQKKFIDEMKKKR